MLGADVVPAETAIGSTAKHKGAIEGVVHGVGGAGGVESPAVGFDHVDKAGAEAQERTRNENLGLRVVAGTDDDGAGGTESVFFDKIGGEVGDDGLGGIEGRKFFLQGRITVWQTLGDGPDEGWGPLFFFVVHKAGSAGVAVIQGREGIGGEDGGDE